MSFELLFIPVFAVLLYAGVYDYKTGKVQMIIPLGMAAIGFVFWSLYSIYAWDAGLILRALFISGYNFGTVFLLSKVGAVGEGDAWLVLGTLMCLPFIEIHPLYFLKQLLFFGVIYGIAYKMLFRKKIRITMAFPIAILFVALGYDFSFSKVAMAFLTISRLLS